MHLGFRFDIDFGFYENPAELRAEFDRGLRKEAIHGNGMDCLISEITCSVRYTSGYVFREDGPVTPADISAFRQWIEQQHIRATVTIGELEDTDDLDILTRKLVGQTFRVDRLTDDDRATAARKQSQMRDWIGRNRAAPD